METQEMVQAKVTLKDNAPESWGARGYRLRKGQSVVVSKPADVRYFQGLGCVNVQMLKGEMPKAPAPLSEPPPPAGGEGAEKAEHTDKTLAKLNKDQLVAVAMDEFGVELNKDDFTKTTLIAEVLRIQAEIAGEEGEDEGEGEDEDESEEDEESDEDDDDEDADGES